MRNGRGITPRPFFIQPSELVAKANRMNRYPAFRQTDVLVRLPLAASTAQLLAAAWIAPSAEIRPRLIERLKYDATLAYWAHRAANCDTALGTRVNADPLSDWLIEEAATLFLAEETGGSVAGPAGEVLAQLARQSAARAQFAMHCGAEADRARLRHFALLSNSHEWFALVTESGSAVNGSQTVSASPNGSIAGAPLRVPTELKDQLTRCIAKFDELAEADWPADVRQAADRAAGLWTDSSEIGFPLALLAQKLHRGKHLEGQFGEALQAQKLESMAELAAGAGHEINNPLAVISGRAQLLLAGETDPERQHDLAVIHAQARRVHEMIADLMLFARPPLPHPTPVDLIELAKQVVREVGKSRLSQPTTRIRIRFAAEEPRLEVLADAAQLGVALRALLQNAVEAIGDAGDIEIKIESSGDTKAPGARAVIRDSGPGIAEAVRAHLFDPFFSGRTAGRGLGMGLAKAWRIVTNHNGTLEVTNPPGGGAEFVLTLPCAVSASGAAVA